MLNNYGTDTLKFLISISFLRYLPSFYFSFGIMSNGIKHWLFNILSTESKILIEYQATKYSRYWWTTELKFQAVSENLVSPSKKGFGTNDSLGEDSSLWKTIIIITDSIDYEILYARQTLNSLFRVTQSHNNFSILPLSSFNSKGN